MPAALRAGGELEETLGKECVVARSKGYIEKDGNR